MALKTLASAVFAALGAVSSLAMAQSAQQDPAALLEAAPDSVWVEIDPENLLVMELPAGRVLIELQPALAPDHVERVRTLARQGFYNNTVFHRVIDGFVAQGGDPQGTGQGGSELPDLVGEMVRVYEDVEGVNIVGRDDRAAQVGFIGTVPVATQPPTMPGLLVGDEIALWGLHCPGVLSMARANDPNSANSQYFLMLGDSREGLDQGYTVWGNAVAGTRFSRRINRGEPPARPTPVVRMRIMADLPAEEQERVEYLRTDSETFRAYLVRTGAMTEDGYFEETCNIDVPVRINGEIQE